MKVLFYRCERNMKRLSEIFKTTEKYLLHSETKEKKSYNKITIPPGNYQINFYLAYGVKTNICFNKLVLEIAIQSNRNPYNLNGSVKFQSIQCKEKPYRR